MPTTPPPLPDDLRRWAQERLERLAAATGRQVPASDALLHVLAASDFAGEVLRHEPEALHHFDTFLAQDHRRLVQDQQPWPVADDAEAMRRLRRLRRLGSLHIAARDILGHDDVPTTLAATSALAEHCIEMAVQQAESALQPRFGMPHATEGGEPVRLAVLAMGKLGGGELNFSSDVDLIFAFAAQGRSVGARELDNEDWFARLGQRLIQLLAEVTADGFAYRVDMRLRPFGTAGRLALSFAAMEHYYQRDGRDWERYAWIKARAVAGDRGGGAQLIAQLAPFVYRRYLDYTAIDGLREMKALIDVEVSRRELADHLKLGPGGIREAEFLVQLVQLVRGGRAATLRTPSFREALAAARALGHIDDGLGAQLEAAYLFLRRVENRIQMLADEQAHALPADALARRRIAVGLGFADDVALVAAIDTHRGVIAAAFADTLHTPRTRGTAVDADWQSAWLALAGGAATLPPPFGERASEAASAFVRTAAFRALDGRAKSRLDGLMPHYLARFAAADDPDGALARLLALFNAVLGRPTYLALLDEQPAARDRLAEVMLRSAFLAERVAAHPLLLDDLLDARLERALPTVDETLAAIRAAWDDVDGGDVEQRLARVAEVRHSAIFRLALAWLARSADADTLAACLANVAAATVQAVLDLALADTTRQWGALGDSPGIAVLGYGSLGGAELGFTSDLDLVFVTDAAMAAATSSGTRGVDGTRWFARVAQRLVHWLTTSHSGGALYAVDTRLRPDGSKGLLVTSLDAFAAYQRERAWVWEHQALVRARPVAGDPALMGEAASARRQLLATTRDTAALREKVRDMRERWRTQLDRSTADRFDLKQGRGGLVDLEFCLQYLVLCDAAEVPSLTAHVRTRELIAALAGAGKIQTEVAAALTTAHATLLGAALDATLNGAPRVVRADAAVQAARDAVLRFAASLALPVAGTGA